MGPDFKTGEHESFRICLFGADLDTSNMGCSALTMSLIGLFYEAMPGIKIQLLQGNQLGGKRQVQLPPGKAVEIEIVNCRMSPRSHLCDHRLWIITAAFLYRLLPSLRSRLIAFTPWLRSLLEADQIADIRGGDSLSDIYGLWKFLLTASEYLVVVLLGRRMILLPQTCGPFDSTISRKVARWILKQAPLILVRDHKSEEVARNLVGDGPFRKTIKVCPDVAFSLPALVPPHIEIDPPLEFDTRVNIVGFNVSGLLYMGGYTHDNMFRLQCDYPIFCTDLIRRFASIPDTQVLLIPHTFSSDPQGENDQEACRKIWESLRSTSVSEKVHLLKGSYNQSEIKSIIGQCDFFLGSRMHACIAGLSQKIPSVGLAYSRKFAGVFETVGVEDMALDMRELSAENLIQRCVQLFEQRSITAWKLAVAITHVQKELHETFAREVLDCDTPKPL